MKPGARAWIALLVGLLGVASFGYPQTGTLRAPVWAGKFYPADPLELADTIAALTRRAADTPLSLPQPGTLRALLLPHAGYPYSGFTAAHASRVLQPGAFTRVVLLGPDHRAGLQNAVVSDVRAYDTPLGRIPLDAAAEDLRRRSALFGASTRSDRSEHALEVVLPFLQTYIGDFNLVPIVLGPTDSRAVAEDLAPLMDRRTLLVVSSDLSHFLPYPQAVEHDRETLGFITALAGDALGSPRNRACGAVPLLVAIELAQRYGWQASVLHYANSGDTAGDRDRVVGYAAVAFFEPPATFSDEQGRILLRLARSTLKAHLTPGGDAPAVTVDTVVSADPAFQLRRGTFVTLQRDGQLRGCIGSLEGDESVAEGVRRHALDAALRDPRFSPLRAAELAQIRIEISILSAPQPLAYTDADDLTAKLRAGIDGVVITQGRARATFLPQVWQQLPSPEAFLSRLCQKAGLGPDAWRRSHPEVFTYQVQHFHEPD